MNQKENEFENSSGQENCSQEAQQPDWNGPDGSERMTAGASGLGSEPSNQEDGSADRQAGQGAYSASKEPFSGAETDRPEGEPFLGQQTAGPSAPPAGRVKEFRWEDVEPGLYGRRSINRGRRKPENEPKALRVFAVVVSCVLAVTLGMLAFVLVVDLRGNLTDNGVSDYSAGSSEENEYSGHEDGPSLVLSDTPDSSSEIPVTGGVLTIPQIAAKVRPSVVGIVSYTEESGMQASGVGSGIIMTSDGYIITNEHVIADAAAVKVVMENGDEFEAEIVGADSKTDLAVVKIEQDNLTPAEFGDSDKLVAGETVVAIGNPGGLKYAGSVTQGIVSATNRLVSASSDTSYTLNCIQTDTAINPGNSGGPLVNVYGQVIGINSSKIAKTGYEGMAFSIAINEAKPIIDKLIQYGYVPDRMRIGLTVTPIDEVLSELYGVPVGLRVLSVEDGTDAKAQGIEVGDIIVKADGNEMTEFSDLSDLLSEKKAGDSIVLDIYRPTSDENGRNFQVVVKLIEERGN